MILILSFIQTKEKKESYLCSIVFFTLLSIIHLIIHSTPKPLSPALVFTPFLLCPSAVDTQKNPTFLPTSDDFFRLPSLLLLILCLSLFYYFL